MDPNVRPFLEQLGLALRREEDVKSLKQPEDSGSLITSGMRDGSAHVLRCLKVWYDLPSDVFFGAVSSIDRFLAKMRAQPKHLSCIAVSAFHWASQRFEAAADFIAPDPADLVTISQSRCSPSDLLRMQNILASKLGDDGDEFATALDLLRLMWLVATATARRLGFGADVLEQRLPARLVHQLEILACDSNAWLGHRPSEVALAVLATEFRRRGNANSALFKGVVGELQKFCGVSSAAFVDCLNVVSALLERYNGAGAIAHRQRLVWKLSNRTLRHLRPTDRLRPTLPTIKEATYAAAAAQALASGGLVRKRTNSESSGSEMESSGSESDSSVDESVTKKFYFTTTA